jgi:hypothetical protein
MPPHYAGDRQQCSGGYGVQINARSTRGSARGTSQHVTETFMPLAHPCTLEALDRNRKLLPDHCTLAYPGNPLPYSVTETHLNQDYRRILCKRWEVVIP